MKAQLRNHPKMKWQGISAWPPGWGGSYGPGTVFPIGEQGVLKKVEILETDRIDPRRLVLTIDYLGNASSGDLTFDDPVMVSKVYDILKACIGFDLSHVGAVELDA